MPVPLPVHSSLRSMSTNTTSVVALTALLLAGCTETVDTGGGAGDSNEGAQGAALITPLVGIYQLPGNWEGPVSGEAYLQIGLPDASGEATSLVHRLDAMNNCIEPRPARGRVSKDPVSDRVFLDAFDFGSATLAKTGNQLIINLTEDVQDIDGDNDFDEPAQLSAIQLDLMLVDLGNTCQ